MISFEPLRELLKERHITSYYLRNKCGKYNLDSKTIQRLMSDQSVSTNTLDSLCHILHCNIEELVHFRPDSESDNNQCGYPFK